MPFAWWQSRTSGTGSHRCVRTDSNRAVSIVNRGYIYTYDGSSWTEHNPAGSAQYWNDCDILEDGSKAIGAAYNGRLWVYDGSSWTETRPKGDVNGAWIGFKMSADGTKYIACDYNGRLYVYSDSSWTEHQPAGNTNYKWSKVGISADGTKYIACAGLVAGYTDVGRIYVYDGSSWTEHRPIDDNNYCWYVSMSKDGTKYMAATQDTGGRVFIYDGSAWTETYPLGSGNHAAWRGHQITNNMTAIIGAHEGRIFYLKNNSWIEQRPGGRNNAYQQWYTHISPDGTKVCAGRQSGPLFFGNFVSNNSITIF